jgi:hypothetical protein
VAADVDVELGRLLGIEPWIIALLQKCGVEHFEQLTEFSPEGLAAILREQAFIELSPQRIDRDDWLGQANRLRSANNLRTAARGPDGDPTTNRAATDSDAQQTAGFSLFFDEVVDEQGAKVWQTRVYHDESEQEIVLPGTEPGPWSSWILSHVLTEAQGGASPLGGDVSPSPPSTHHLTVGILGAQLTRGDTSNDQLGEMSVEVRFQVSGLSEVERALGRTVLGAVIARGS